MTLRNTASSNAHPCSQHFPFSSLSFLNRDFLGIALYMTLKPLAGLLSYLVPSFPRSLATRPEVLKDAAQLESESGSVRLESNVKSQAGASANRLEPGISASSAHSLAHPEIDFAEDAKSEYYSVCNTPHSALGTESPFNDMLSSEDSISIDHAINYRRIHYLATERVLDKLLRQSSGNARHHVDELATLIRQSSNSQSFSIGSQSRDLDGLKLDLGGRGKCGKLMLPFLKFSREQAKLIKAGRKGKQIPRNLHVHIRTALASVVHGKCLSLGLTGKNYDVGSIDRKIFEQYVDVLQKQKWETIVRKQVMEFPDEKDHCRKLSFLTTMTPAKNLDNDFHQAYSNDDVNGICSYANRENRHAVNLWRTEFGLAPASESAESTSFFFSGLRHGVHDAYGLENAVERNRANDARVKEFVRAAALEHINRNKAQLDMTGLQEVLDIDIVSVNLLTPRGKEKTMVEHQRKALERASGRTIDIQVEDDRGNRRTVLVKPRIIMFNTPVNLFSLSRLGSLVAGWGSADKANKEALITLVGSTENSKSIGGLAAKKVAGLKAESRRLSADNPEHFKRQREITAKIELIHQLTAQIRDIFTRKAHHGIGNEPYKLPTRLLALANEIGAVPAFNCKSGKDRTGQQNVEIRDLYADLNASNGKLRDADIERTGFSRKNYQQLFLAGGDRQIQILNTGAPGSKSQLPYYNKLLGVSPKTIDEIKGLSKWVGT
jgi:phosphatidylinositol-4,5-bisphosphate 4-phosphatase